MRSSRAQFTTAVAAVAVIYLFAAKLGFTVAFLAAQVTVVWPPSGLALAALLIFGFRMWPGVLLGAFLANATTSEPLSVAVAIAIGNTAEAVIGAWLLTRIVKIRRSLTRLRDVLGLVFAAIASTVISAAIGVTSLCVGGVQPWEHYGFLFFIWWLGDAMGDLLFAPVLLAASGEFWRRWRAAQIAELAATIVLIVAVSTVVFAGSLPVVTVYHPFEYFVFPLAIWAAVRCGLLGATLATVAVTAVATWGTSHGLGPFTTGTTGESLILLQTFNAVLAITGLVLAATTSERQSAERYRDIGYMITRILAEPTTLSEAQHRILAEICKDLGWQVGALWSVDRQGAALRCDAFSASARDRVARFEAATRQRTFARGIGLPGRVWSTAKPVWLADIVHDDNFPRGPIAAEEGLHGAFAFPIMLTTIVIGVIEFFSTRIEEPNDDLLQAMATIGGQIGQVMERKRFEGAVHESEARKTAVLEAALDAIVTMDHDGTIVEFNPAAERMFGYGRAAVIGKPMVEQLVPPQMRAAHLQGLTQYLATGSGSVIGTRREMTAMRADGSEFAVELAIARIPLGDPPMFTAYIRDITVANQLRAELQQQAEQLADADRRKDEFIAMLSHELRNPLAPIRNAVEVIDRLDPGDPQVRWACDVAKRQVRHMTRLIDDLLDISRITTRTMVLQTATVELRSIVSQAIETSQPLIDARRHQLTLAVPTEPMWLRADSARLAQAFANLIINAGKYTEAGGHIWLSAERTGTDVVVRVRDSGIGIAPDRLGRIFAPFSQIDSSLDRAQGGLGIGLSVVKNLVELHGGDVQAFSEGLGRGSEFVVRLPLAPEEAVESGLSMPPTVERPVPVAATHRILVVDDNRDAAESLSELLTLMGHDVRISYDGRAGLALARQYAPDVILLDIGLPDMDGYAVARGLRSDAALKDVFIVALTGYGRQSDRLASKAAGFDRHLVKPVDLDALRALLAGLGPKPHLPS